MVGISNFHQQMKKKNDIYHLCIKGFLKSFQFNISVKFEIMGFEKLSKFCTSSNKFETQLDYIGNF